MPARSTRFATGLLLIMDGSATRVSSLLMGLPKEYDLLVQFGAVSSTGDPTGEIAPFARDGSVAMTVTAHEVEAVLDRFRGRITQRVPLTSAVKVDGEPLYKKAHRGETADTPEREVMVYDLTLVEFDEAAQTARLLALTGSGTYARVLAIDIGEALGCGGYAAGLRRTRVGMFSVLDALSPGRTLPSTLRGRGPRGAQPRPGSGVHTRARVERHGRPACGERERTAGRPGRPFSSLRGRSSARSL